MSGWIKLQRKFLEWEWYGNSQMVHLFIHMMLKANRENKKWQGISVKTGSFISSISKLSQETGISIQSVRTAVRKLENTRELTCRPTNKHTLFTLVKWRDYQHQVPTTNKQDINQLTINQQSTNNQLTTTKEVKKVRSKEEKKETPKEKAAPSSLEIEFNSFWDGCHVKRGSKPTALKSWEQMRKKNLTELSAVDLAEAFNRLVATKGEGEQQFIPHISTWLNQQRWDEELPEAPKQFPFNLPQWECWGQDYPHLNGVMVYYEEKENGRVFGPEGELLDKYYIELPMEGFNVR